MEVQVSNNVVAINSDDDDVESSDKPIIQLFKQLTEESNQKTVLTNAQIINILKEEFNIDIWNKHELEGDIYITIVKMYLKDWPLWEDFDKLVNSLKHKDTNAMNEVMQSNYKKLKEHLAKILDKAKEEAKNTVDQYKKEVAEISDKVQSNVILEITASRSQLNKLFYRQPLPKLNNTIFNSTKHAIPTQIMVNEIPLDAILNWWGMNILVKASGTKINIYERQIKHDLKHVLINKNLMVESSYTELDQDLKVRVLGSSRANVTEFIQLLDKSPEEANRAIYDFIKKDLKLLPDIIFYRSTYSRYTNKYPYIRYLYQDAKNPDIHSRKYDIQLQETISPKYQVYIRTLPVNSTILIVECDSCGVKFLGPNLIQELRAHFNEFHLGEPDCSCSKCGKTFPIVALAQRWWCHRC